MPEKVEGVEETNNVPSVIKEDSQPTEASEPAVVETQPEPEQRTETSTENEKSTVEEEEDVVSPTAEKKKRGRRSSDGPSSKRSKVKDAKTPERLSRRLKNQKSGSKLPEIKDGDALLPKKERRKSSTSSITEKSKEKNGDASDDDEGNKASEEKPADDLNSAAIAGQPQPVEVA